MDEHQLLERIEKLKRAERHDFDRPLDVLPLKAPPHVAESLLLNARLTWQEYPEPQQVVDLFDGIRYRRAKLKALGRPEASIQDAPEVKKLTQECLAMQNEIDDIYKGKRGVIDQAISELGRILAPLALP